MSETGKYVVLSPPLAAWVKPIECDSQQHAEDVCGALRRVCGAKFGASCGWEVQEQVRGDENSSFMHEVFDGHMRCLVPCCCDSDVIQVSVTEAEAHKYMVAAPTQVSQKFVCAKCRRDLPCKVIPKN